MRFASFFAGVGGFDLGFQQAGLSPAFHCEIDEYCQKVLKRHWPTVPLHGDINSLVPEEIPNAELWSAGWPCQDLSHANSKREGLDGRRSGLFFKFAELAAIKKPRWIVLENVSGLLSADNGRDFERVIDELEEIGYLGIWFSCNLLSVGIPQNRERVFLIGSYKSELSYKFYTDSSELLRDYPTRAARWSGRKAGSELSESSLSDDPLLVQRRGGFGYTKAASFSPTLRAQTGRHQGGHTDRPIVCGQKLDLERVRETDGVPRGMDGRRGRFIGNAVAPPIAKFIGSRILEIEREVRLLNGVRMRLKNLDLDTFAESE
ncbi:MAG: DNA (cytosine-5-)-methyltransferase [Novosphingobium sp.]|uniref:DNA cytosine methyltransferase n=1 Tax=Novosphingobium sp. TaxID=1874826 RepID=UPI002737291D|nr:DNA (cytosine-5-)-methyltransferase [Novosphingobium sp.]MDP3551766.1 DNA (cytosine-5-)-methyltransferase [Novosphingobium sp.]